MDKKEYLRTILTQLEWKWSLARWLKFLIENWNLDDEMLDIISQSIELAIDTTGRDRDFIEFKKAVKKS